MSLTVGSLFSGIGGLDLGLERAGMRVEWQCEIDSYCQAVLRKHWPDTLLYSDIRNITRNAPRVDLIAGGFPCQPVSLAGRGKAQSDERWLWPEFERVVGLLRPRYVLVENVPGLATRGLGDVVGSLTALGYDAEWDVVSAASVGAPHIRERIFVVAYRDSQRPQGHGRPTEGSSERATATSCTSCGIGPMAHANGERQPECGLPEGEGKRGLPHATGCGGCGSCAAEQRDSRDEGAAMAHADDSRCDRRPRYFTEENWWRESANRREWATEPDVGRVANGVPRRVDRLRALGNAVVPQVGEYVGRLILDQVRQVQPLGEGQSEEQAIREPRQEIRAQPTAYSQT